MCIYCKIFFSSVSDMERVFDNVLQFKDLVVPAESESVLILLPMNPFQNHRAIPNHITQINRTYIPCIRICICYTPFSLLMSCSLCVCTSMYKKYMPEDMHSLQKYTPVSVLIFFYLKMCGFSNFFIFTLAFNFKICSPIVLRNLEEQCLKIHMNTGKVIQCGGHQ